MMTFKLHLHVCSYAWQDWFYSLMTFYTQYIVTEIGRCVGHNAFYIHLHLYIQLNRGHTETSADLASDALSDETNKFFKVTENNDDNE